MTSLRNRTIRLTDTQQAAYAERCRIVTAPVADAAAVCDSIICGDCFAVLPLLPPASVDLLIADPPYNLDKAFDGSAFHRMDRAAYIAYTERWLNACLPLLKPDAAVFVCGDWRCGGALEQVLSAHLHIRNRITWQREKGRGSSKNFKSVSEDIWYATVSERDFVFHADAVRHRRRVTAPYRVDGVPRDWAQTADGKFRDTGASNFWDDITVPYWSMPENTEHPTQKPEKLLAKLILAASDAGDTVLDPFLGSGSTAVTAKKLGRHFIGIEQSERYCALAQYRLEQADTDTRIQGYAHGVFHRRHSAE